MYIGSFNANTASATAIIPIIKTSIDVNLDNFENNPVIPNTIIINPTM